MSIETNFGEVQRMEENFKRREVVLTIDEKLEIIKSIDAGTSYTVPVRHKVYRNLCSNVFAPQPGHVQLLYETRSNEKPNAFEREAKRVQMRN